ncbi:pyridoxal-phosphate dependent enzyme [Streptomyces sp. C10]|uniref:pyridoxal-phosphate dependent enzyme n=1 Tax=Streptomyces sp. C10 TaxID=531941 RepID=UPI00397FEDA0
MSHDTTVVESSSGNFALALAFYCRMLGISFVPVIDPNCNEATEAQLRLLCGRVEKVAIRDAAGSYLKTRLSRVQELLVELDSAYWPNQYANPDARDAGDSAGSSVRGRARSLVRRQASFHTPG